MDPNLIGLEFFDTPTGLEDMQVHAISTFLMDSLRIKEKVSNLAIIIIVVLTMLAIIVIDQIQIFLHVTLVFKKEKNQF